MTPRLGYKECPACAEEIRENAKICRYCRAVLTDGAIPAFAPPDDQAHVVQLEEDGSRTFEDLGVSVTKKHLQRLEKFLKGAEEQYRTASVLFIDIVGYSALSEKLKPELVKDILDAYYGICSATVDQYNGFILEFQGDGCLAVFGAPVAYDRDAESAVRAALEIRDRVRALPGMHGHRVRVRAGIETGEVLCSVIRSQQPPVYKVFGPAVNLASRIETAADADRILVGPDTYLLTRQIFAFRKKPARKFRNIEQPVVTYEVLQPRAEGATRRDFTISFVGRTVELAVLEKAFRMFVDASEPELSTAANGVVLIGEPGIGKTRLVLEFARRHGDTATHCHVESAPHEAKVPFALWREMLVAIAGLREAESTASRHSKLTAKLRKLGQSPKDQVPFLALYGDLDAAEQLSHIGMGNRRRLLAEAVSRLLALLAGQRHLILQLDDLQWVDSSSLELLNDVVSLRPLRVFFALLHRTGVVLEGDRLKSLPRVTLGPLDQKSRMSLVTTLADSMELLPEIRDMLVEEAAGNPFHTTELMKAFCEFATDKGGLSDPTAIVNRLRELVPLSLREMLQSRIDLLDRKRKLVLQCGAVLGRRFALQVIELLDFIRDGLLGRLYTLKTWELLDDSPSAAGLEFVFRHHVTREVAYQSLLERQRADLHRIVAEKIEEKYADAPQSHAAVLAYHFAQAGDNERSSHYLELCGDQAAAIGAVPEALDSYDQAQMRLRKCPQDNKHRERLARVLCAKGRLLRLVGQSSDAFAVLEAAAKIAAKHGRKACVAEVHTELGLVAVHTGDYPRARTELSVARDLVRSERTRG